MSPADFTESRSKPIGLVVGAHFTGTVSDRSSDYRMRVKALAKLPGGARVEDCDGDVFAKAQGHVWTLLSDGEPTNYREGYHSLASYGFTVVALPEVPS